MVHWVTDTRYYLRMLQNIKNKDKASETFRKSRWFKMNVYQTGTDFSSEMSMQNVKGK